MRGLIAAFLVVILGVGCSGPQGPLRVGAKDFEEQLILAHMLAELARSEGMRAILVECQDTYGCQQAMRRGQVDVMVEYSGTASVLGGLAAAGDAPGDQRALYEGLGMRWLGDLGFDNSYEMVVPTARAASLDLRAISDLSRLEGGLRIATPSVYARRPGDGLFPLLRRYGLRLAEPPLLFDQPAERYEAVLTGRADAAVAYATDGALAGRRLRALEDPLDFFPPYQGGVVARADAVSRYPQLEGLVAKLQDRLDTATMRRLNGRAQMEGQAPAAVAADFLRTAGLIKEGGETAREAELFLAAHEGDRLSAETNRALRAVRQAFPQRSVTVVEGADPIGLLADGGARLAVLGGERFFTGGGESPERDQRAEAVAVVGTRTIHLVRRQRHDAQPLAGRIGVLPSGSGAARVATDILELAGKKPARHGQPRELLRGLREGRLDGVLVLTEVPDPEFAEALARFPDLHFQALDDRPGGRRGMVLPYLRATRIPAGSYPHQPDPVETVGSQVVVAGPAPQDGGAARVGGPAAALRTAGLPLSEAEVDGLVAASTVKELPDPVLPSPWSLSGGETRTGGAAFERVLDTVLNVLVWGFLLWLVFLLLRPARQA
ncbi:glycine betaine ABC transporter substrate-binding protein [Thiohalorhabdus sp. Cl-TMA]|uniref:Glycine betaine ABC transporter substrate-binding protein n=1 Tax=Thiohalorhabdus methylotrophus TaxID=3242694 RepID=A0ABV4TTB8_9GAMM